MENAKNRMAIRKKGEISFRSGKKQFTIFSLINKLTKNNFDKKYCKNKTLNEDGFITFFILGMIPILFAAGISLCYAQYLTGNWMQSKHTCRVTLLQTQKEVAPFLSQLLSLNPRIKTLRIALHTAKLQRAAAIASQNPVAEIAAEAKIEAITLEQLSIHHEQQQLIQIANQKMSSAVYKVRQLLFKQNQEMQQRIPSAFKFKIENIQPRSNELAVTPDAPTIPPVYELKYDFMNEQTLSVNWNTSFLTTDARTKKWFHINLKKHDGCAASLEADNQIETNNLQFIYRLNEDKF